mmetsp:Transcript_20790/g.64963  ORF Transcript_20790/g.64963 Transcript_20790/m.64963 type:complete len:175 (-) Transcript_20790:98-622(-)
MAAPTINTLAAIVALNFALVPDVFGMDVRSHMAHANKLAEEVKAFEEGAQMLESSGWRAFLDTASVSARSVRDRQRSAGVDEAVDEERRSDVSVSDDFASKIEEQSDMPTLQQLAREHWAGIAPERPKAGIAPRRGQGPESAGQPQRAAAQPQQPPALTDSLRTLLQSAGRAVA